MINYVFHIGQRCQSLEFLRINNLLSGYNCFSGLYISFNSIIKIINNDFNDFDNYIVKFTIDKLKNEVDNSIEFIRCYDYSEEKMNDLKLKIIDNKFNFFFSKNFYSNKNYCINLKYTDECNFKENDLYFWKNNYCLMPNSDYSNIDELNRINRRKERFENILKTNKTDTILLIYMDQLLLDNDIDIKINDITNYNLPYNLFYIIPIYSETTKNINNEKIIKHNNITIYTIYFESIEFQKINNPNDDNNLSYVEQYKKIKEQLLKSYEFDIVNLF
jgi:hypothetical protein